LTKASRGRQRVREVTISLAVFRAIARRSFVLATSLAAISAAGAEPAVTNIRFGILRTISEGVFEFESETRKLPKRLKASGFRFGVGFDNPTCSPIEWYEIMHLPSDTKDVTGNLHRSGASTLQMKTQQTSQPSVVDDFWFDEGDPLGKHTIELYVNGALQFKAEFEVFAGF
jgi:hypothetical protein